MSPAQTVSQLSILSSAFGLAWQRSLESFYSSDGISSHSSQTGLAPPANQKHVLSGRHTYQQVAHIGQGSFGTVVRALQLDADPVADVAIKLLPRGSSMQAFKKFIRREIVHQSSLQHPFIISLKEVFLTPTHLALAMEYAPGGDLYQHVAARKPFPWLPEEQARWIFQQLIIGLDYCHHQGVAVRDLKLENMLLSSCWTNGQRPLLKICDFGYSKHADSSPAKTHVGTPVYMAPEIILGGKYDATKADLWSCGVILYSMLYGRYPFDAQDKGYTKKICAAQYTIPIDVPVSDACKHLMQCLLVANVKERIVMKEVLMHPWFRWGLPAGALDMNKPYLAYPLCLDQFMWKVDAILEQAMEPGYEGEDLSHASVSVPKTPLPPGK